MSSRSKKKQDWRKEKTLREIYYRQVENLARKELSLNEYLRGRRLIYLDVNHWINLVRAMHGHQGTTTLYTNILTSIRDLQAKGKVCCPLSAPMIEELMFQEDLTSRKDTASLMDELSNGICLQYMETMARKEWSVHVWKALKNDIAIASTIWTRPGLWRGEDFGLLDGLLLDLKALDKSGIGGQDAALLEDIFSQRLDEQWNLSFESLTLNPDFERISKDITLQIVESLKDRIPFSEKAFLNKWWDMKLAFFTKIKDSLFNAPLPPDCTELPQTLFSEIILDNSPDIIPVLQVWSKIMAAVTTSNRKLETNDLFDYMHATYGVSYYDVFACDKRTANFLKTPPLELDRTYPVTIVHSGDELLDYLSHI